jgi:hypothetical protein
MKSAACSADREKAHPREPAFFAIGVGEYSALFPTIASEAGCGYSTRLPSIHTMLHNVYFWLKPDLTAEQIATFESELRLLVKIEYLAHAVAARPADTEKRPVTDHSFSYSTSLLFKNMADHEFYQKDCPQHKRFVETCKSMWDRVLVYDNAPLH